MGPSYIIPKNLANVRFFAAPHNGAKNLPIFSIHKPAFYLRNPVLAALSEMRYTDGIAEAIQLLREKLDKKNVYFMNPAIDM